MSDFSLSYGDEDNNTIQLRNHNIIIYLIKQKYLEKSNGISLQVPSMETTYNSSCQQCVAERAAAAASATQPLSPQPPFCSPSSSSSPDRRPPALQERRVEFSRQEEILTTQQPSLS